MTWDSGIGFYLNNELTQVYRFSILGYDESDVEYVHTLPGEAIIGYDLSEHLGIPSLSGFRTVQRGDYDFKYYVIDGRGIPTLVDYVYDAWNYARELPNGNKTTAIWNESGSQLILKTPAGTETIISDSVHNIVDYSTVGIPDYIYFWEFNSQQSQVSLFRVGQNGENRVSMNISSRYGAPLKYCTGYLYYYDSFTGELRRMLPDGADNTVIYRALVPTAYDIPSEVFVADNWVRLYNGTAGFGIWFNSYSELLPAR
jgi:hypothetical protein